MSKRKLDEQPEGHENYQSLSNRLYSTHQPNNNNLGTPLVNQNNFIQSSNLPQQYQPQLHTIVYNQTIQPPIQIGGFVEQQYRQHPAFVHNTNFNYNQIQQQQHLATIPSPPQLTPKQLFANLQQQQQQFPNFNYNQIQQSPQLTPNRFFANFEQQQQQQQFPIENSSIMPRLPNSNSSLTDTQILKSINASQTTPPPPPPLPKLESSIVDRQGKEITLSNLLIIKIFQYKLQYLKDDTKNHGQPKTAHQDLYDFLNCIQMICKSWNLFVIPKLDIGKYGYQDTRCNDYIGAFSKLKRLSEQIHRGYLSTGYQFAFKRSAYKNYDPISKLLSMLYQPTHYSKIESLPYSSFSSFSSGFKKTRNTQIPVTKEQKTPTILVNGIDFGTTTTPNVSNIVNFSKPSLFDNSPNEIVQSTSHSNILESEHTIIHKPSSYSKDTELFKCGYPNYRIEFDKILIYKEGVQYTTDHLNKSDENNNGSPKLGVMLHSFCTTDYQGGEFEFLHSLDNDGTDNCNSSSKVTHTVKFEIESQYKQYTSISFFNGSLLNIKPITSGINILVKYNIRLDTTHSFHLNEENYHNDQDGDGDGDEDEESPLINFNNITKHLISPLNENSLSISSLSNYNYSVIHEISNILNKSDLKVHNVALFLNKHYKNSGAIDELSGIDLIIYEKLKEIYGSSRLSISTFLIKAGSPHTIEILSHQSVALGLHRNDIKHTLVYPSERFIENLITFQEADDYEHNGVDSFSAIVIKKENK